MEILEINNYKDIFDSVKTFKIVDKGELLSYYPQKIVFLNDNEFLWFEDRGDIFKYNTDGELLKKYTLREGNGPGEIRRICDVGIDSTERKIFIYDSRQMKIITYDYEFKYINDFLLKGAGFKNFVLDDSHNFYIYHDIGFNIRKPAISIIGSNGDTKEKIGEIPLAGIFQQYLEGGGICLDSKRNIYYTYLGDFRIWKYSTETREISTYDYKPSYFIAPEEKILKEDDQMKVIRHHFSVSKVRGLEIIDDRFLVQQIEGILIEKGRNRNKYIEILDLQKNKRYTKVEGIAGKILGKFKDRMFFYNRLDESTVQFDVYSLKKNIVIK